MNLTQCANGHYYDMDKFQSCPFCSGGSQGGGEDTTTEAFVNPGDVTVGGPSYNQGGGFDSDVTVSDSMYNQNQQFGGGNFGGGYGDSFGGSNIETTEAFTDAPTAASSVTGVTDYGNIPDTSEDDGDKTVGFLNWNAVLENDKKQEGGQKVSADDKRRATVNPAVGWLVCISGSNYGQSFTLHSGKNFIGRDKDANDVYLSGDNSISRVKHAVVIYEPKRRQFFAQPGDASHELFYLNDNVVLSNTILKDRDVITLGQTSLVFVPFCDERYGWDVPQAE